MLIALVGSYYYNVTRLFNIYAHHSDWIFICNVTIVLATLIAMSMKHGYTGRSSVGDGDGSEYLIVPFVLSILTWLAVFGAAVFLYILPVLLIALFPYYIGTTIRRLKNKINPGPFADKLQASDFEVKNDWSK